MGANETTRRGRDRRHRSPARTNRVNVRLNDDEFAAVSRAASESGLTASGYCAEVALAAAREESSSGIDRLIFRRLGRDLFAARAAVNKFGSNVNQVAAAFNSTGVLPEYAQAAIDVCRRSVERVDAVLAELRRLLE
ncbi:plasmid mobilization protein [Cryptosporangium sp. NPDC051539]|uniref:plasmid mobilization protein n=1 Tax=Cryptosporangium sp. NPDC051539 TaxID=3363962 RepID=UPI0037BC1758